MKQFIDIIRHRENLGFILGCLVTIMAYEFHYNLIWLALVCCFSTFVGWPLIKKYGN